MNENKFKAFFRPRSRSRPRPLAHTDTMSSTSHSNIHHNNHTNESFDPPPSSYPKPSLRPQTRPISSTTTATHSTITPLPSDNRMNGPRHAYAFHPHSVHSTLSLSDVDRPNPTAPHDPNDHRFPRSETPPSTKPRLLLQALFGISLSRRSPSSTSNPQQSSSTSVRKGSTSTSASEPPTKSSRKRSFRLTSRPTTPKSVDDPCTSKSPYSIPVPSNPLPLSASPRRRSFGLGSSQRSTPKSSSSNLPLPHLQSPQNPRSHTRRHSVGSERPPHDSAVALSEESSHQSVHKTALALPDSGFRNKGKEREKLFTPSQSPLPDPRPPIDFPSHSLPIDPSPMSQNNHASHSTGHSLSSHLPAVDSASSEENEQSSLLVPHRLPIIPRIIHTPPTPQRPGEAVGSTPGAGVSPPAINSSKFGITKPKAVTIAHREQLLVSNPLSHVDPQHSGSSKGRFTPRIFGGKDLPKIKESNGQQSRGRLPAHSSDSSTHKASSSNVTGPMRNMTNHRSKLGSFDFERPVSVLNRSTSTVDRHGPRISRDNLPYSKPYLHSSERTISEDSAPGGNSRSATHHPGQTDLPALSPIKPVHTGDTSVISFSSVSVQTMSTGKAIVSNMPVGQSSSWGRASGRRIPRTSHGTFAFEHPLSAPSSPNPQNSNLPVGSNQNEGHVSGVVQTRSITPLHTIFDTRARHLCGQSYNTSERVELSSSKRSDRKSKGKGRSLDLGLGLSWAPSRVREDVLMPGLILTREKAKLDKSKANGSGVTKVFESILSESRFQTFKEYVHRFDAHIIPLEGPSGLLVRVDNLLAEAGLSEQEREKLMSDFNLLVEDHSG